MRQQNKKRRNSGNINWLMILGIISTIAAGPVFGIPVIVLSIKAKTEDYYGNYTRASQFRLISKILLILYIVYIVIIGGVLIVKNTSSNEVDEGLKISSFSKNEEENNGYEAEDIDLSNIDLGDYSTIPVYVEEKPFTLPTKMSFLDKIGYTYEDETVEPLAYKSINASKGDSTIVLTCKNTSDTNVSIKDCVVVSTYFTENSVNANLYGIAVGDKAEVIEEKLGTCSDIQIVEQEEGEWKDYLYELDGSNIFAEFTVIDGYVNSILFKYENVEGDTDSEEEQEEDNDIDFDMESDDDYLEDEEDENMIDEEASGTGYFN